MVTEQGPGGPGRSADLEAVRSELRRRGYLSPGVGRFLLQDALAPRPAGRAFASLAAKVGLLGGAVFALGGAVALMVANRGPGTRPLDTLPLFFHLLLPATLAVGLAFLVLSIGFTLLVTGARIRRTEAWALGVALGVAGSLAAVLWRVRLEEAPFPPWQRTLAALAAALAGVFLVRVLYHGLLSLSIRFGDVATIGWPVTRRGLRLGLALAAVVVAMPIALAFREPRPPAPPPSLPSAPGDRVAVVGLDGVLAQELEYLLARGELPRLEERVREVGLGSYLRKVQAPAAFWTTVATGTAPELHGVASLDTFQPLFVDQPLATVGPLRTYFSRVLVPLGLAEHRPLLSSRRRAFAFWELASRGGAPVAVVDWWGTYPAPPSPGTIVAHGAWGLLREGAAGTVEPPERQAELRSLVAAAEARPVPLELVSSLGAEPAAELAHRALWPDQLYREVFAAVSTDSRAGALYLPGLDLAADGWRGGSLAFADLLRRELLAFDQLLGVLGERFETVVVVFDPGRRSDREAQGEGGGNAVEGRVLLWRRAGCGPATAAARPPIEPAAVASAVLRALGLPQSEELPEPPAFCAFGRPPERVPSYGRRSEVAPGAGSEGDYLENLRSLGYL